MEIKLCIQRCMYIYVIVVSRLGGMYLTCKTTILQREISLTMSNHCFYSSCVTAH